jgi:hypothetical protein
MLGFVIIAAAALVYWCAFAWVWRHFKEAADGGSPDDCQFIVQIGGVMCLLTWWGGMFLAGWIGSDNAIFGWICAIAMFFLGLALLYGMVIVAFFAMKFALEREDRITALEPVEWSREVSLRRRGQPPAPQSARPATTLAQLPHSSHGPSAP